MTNGRSRQFGDSSRYAGPSQNRPSPSRLSENINVSPVASRASQLGLGLGKGAGGLGRGVAGGKGKGLGKGSLKRHMKIQRDNIYGVTKGDIRRLARRGGVKRISATLYDDVRQALKERLQVILRDICAILDSSGRKTVSVTDVVFTLRRRGNPIYGFDSAFLTQR
ncbi:histone-fold-containing protein [Stemphylium lycopersici]|uniref:Histone H4 n=1 Tax=Stemphylium lycopersici TaxID=183478 RepID=A0A364MZY7_STELY|nr:histone h4 [Stemphylium lycopersici]RAR08269.1 histone-fold-containing protein [Stemphylium lycopersici]RAR10380.1 histone-fold-containing protein [Stemphylium lycopersici]